MDAVNRLGRWLGGAARPPRPAEDAWALLRQAHAGDAPSAAALVRALAPQAYGLAIRMVGRREDAEDAVQDAFVRLWRSRPADTHGARLSTYFNTIVLNCCRTLLVARRAWVADELPDLPDDSAAPPSHTTAGIGAAASRQRIERGLQQLPARQRMALAMWAYADASVADIARALEIDNNAAHQLLHRAKRGMRASLEGAPDPGEPT
ncbi:MAG TPA: sigma-70 family RNA polymerase sigma factor [Burkholderiaceae bacterium]